MRESFIVQGARLFIPCHSIPLHRISSSDRKRRDNDETRYIIYYTHIYIYILLYTFILFSFSLHLLSFTFFRLLLSFATTVFFSFLAQVSTLRTHAATSHRQPHLIHVSQRLVRFSRFRFRYKLLLLFFFVTGDTTS